MKKCTFCTNSYDARRASQKFCTITCSNRAHLNNKNAVILPERSADLAELFGILLGDGSVVRYYTKIYLNADADRAYWPYVRDLCTTLFPGATVSAIARPKRGTHEIQISSREVSEFLFREGFDPKVRSVPRWIMEKRPLCLRCVRGLFDTEGTVGIKKFPGARGVYVYAQMTFTNKNRNLLAFVESALRSEGFKPTRNAKKNVYISNARDVDRYMLEIGSSNPKFAQKLTLRATAKTGRGARAV